MTAVPDELAEVVHRAARTAPPHAADLASVRRRWRARARRRGAAATGGLVALIALTGGTVPLLAGPDGRPVLAPPKTTPSRVTTTPPAQRLMVDDAGFMLGGPVHAPEIGLRSGPADEVLADGSVVRHRVPNDFRLGTALPDGRLVGLARADLMPGEPREDGPDVAGLPSQLVVLGSDGSVQVRRKVQIKGEAVRLAGADPRTAYLVRPAGLVAHDLATGSERVLLRSAAIGVDILRTDLDVAGGRLAFRRPDDAGCHVEVMGLADTQRARRYLLTLGDECQFRLSPDGSRLAAAYQVDQGSPRTGDRREGRVSVYDIASGVRVADELIGTTGEHRNKGVYGMAWTDEHVVRVLWAQLPAGADRVYAITEVMKIVTVTVQ